MSLWETELAHTYGQLLTGHSVLAVGVLSLLGVDKEEAVGALCDAAGRVQGLCTYEVKCYPTDGAAVPLVFQVALCDF